MKFVSLLLRVGGRRATLAGSLGAIVALGGCGGAHHTPAAIVATANGDYRVAAPFHWLINTTGPQPTIAAENRNRGTGTWRLPGPAGDVAGLAHGDVQGYVADPTLSPGQEQRIYVNAPGSRTVRIEIFRIGWYGGRGARAVLVARSLPVRTQPPCLHRPSTGLTICDWHPTLTFSAPPALPSGVYIVKLTAATGQSDALFVVRSTRPQPLIAQLPTATYEAYNAWGGDSLYPGGNDRVQVTHSAQGVAVSYQRPYDTVTGAGQFFARDVAMVWFIERYGYPVSYTTSESVDAFPRQLLGHRAIIDFGHSEYWSARQASAFARARDAGVSLLFFGSDTLAWRVRYFVAPDRAGTAAGDGDGNGEEGIVAYKSFAARDPDRASPTGPFPKGGAPLTGSAYVGCITPRLRRPGPPTYLYYAWRPSPTLSPAWLYARTGITPVSTIPGIVGYELDQRTLASPAGTEVVGYGTAPCVPAQEIGEPTAGVGQNLAETTLYRAASGALVFNTGSLGWELGLEPVPSASPDAPPAPDPRIVAMTRNLLNHVLTLRTRRTG